MQEIQLIFNAGKGSSALSRITAVVGDRVGAMPKATRKGYIFGGWYICPDGDPDSPDGIRVTAETVLDEALLGDVATDTVLYARWVKPTAATAAKKKTSLGTQKRAIAVLLILAVVLAVAHEEFRRMSAEELDRLFKDGPNKSKILVDVKGLLDRKACEQAGYQYWRL